jgi:hypothetical protein
MAICEVMAGLPGNTCLPTAAHSIRPSNFWRISSTVGPTCSYSVRLCYKNGPFVSSGLDAFDRVMGDGVLLAEILEQGGQCREAVPNRGAAELACDQVIAPGDHMGSGHGAEFLRPGDAGETHEILNGVLVGALRAGVADIGEPLDLGRHLRQPMEFGAGQQAVCRDDFGRKTGLDKCGNPELTKTLRAV